MRRSPWQFPKRSSGSVLQKPCDTFVCLKGDGCMMEAYGSEFCCKTKGNLVFYVT